MFVVKNVHIAIILCLSLTLCDAFTHLRPLVSVVTPTALIQRYSRRPASSSPIPEDEAAPSLIDDLESETMDELIISLSMEPTDDSRRGRLAEIFEMELGNDTPKEFAVAFDAALQRVGTAVQAAARERAAEKTASEAGSLLENRGKNGEIDEDSDLKGSGEDAEAKGFMAASNKEERQLWAMIDLMVQSKTIVKKVNGQLGSEGTFR